MPSRGTSNNSPCVLSPAAEAVLIACRIAHCDSQLEPELEISTLGRETECNTGCKGSVHFMEKRPTDNHTDTHTPDAKHLS